MVSRRSLFRAIGLGSAAWIGGLLPRSVSAGGPLPVRHPSPEEWPLEEANEWWRNRMYDDGWRWNVLAWNGRTLVVRREAMRR